MVLSLLSQAVPVGSYVSWWKPIPVSRRGGSGARPTTRANAVKVAGVGRP